MMSAARGAEQFYTIEHHASRKEGLELARELDLKAAEAWVGHPYVDLVKKKKDFSFYFAFFLSELWNIRAFFT
jgi:hypothetical protein